MTDHKPNAFSVRWHRDRAWFVRVPLSKGHYIRVKSCVVVVACPKCGADPKVPCMWEVTRRKHRCKSCSTGWIPRGDQWCTGTIYRATAHPERWERARAVAGDMGVSVLAEQLSDAHGRRVNDDRQLDLWASERERLQATETADETTDETTATQ